MQLSSILPENYKLITLCDLLAEKLGGDTMLTQTSTKSEAQQLDLLLIAFLLLFTVMMFLQSGSPLLK